MRKEVASVTEITVDDLTHEEILSCGWKVTIEGREPDFEHGPVVLEFTSISHLIPYLFANGKRFGFSREDFFENDIHGYPRFFRA